MSSLGAATAQWAVELLRRVGGEGTPLEAVFLSPVSIAVALGMAYAGADGNTKEQLNRVLFNGLSEKEVHEGFDRLLQDVNTFHDGYTLHMANKLFGQQGYTLLDGFVETLKTHYQSELQSVDFKANANGVTSAINKWVAETTMQLITDLIAPGVLDADTRFVLVNAIYFKGAWKTPFDKDNTSPLPFFVNASVEKRVGMMYKEDKFLYHETGSVQVLGMSYTDGDLGMFVFLPKERFGLLDFERDLNGANLTNLIESSKLHTVQVKVDTMWYYNMVTLPKFKLTSQFQLSDWLKSMGLVDAFSPNADFGRITGAKDLFISKVVHKAFVEVNEEGSEAAAATAVVQKRKRRSAVPEMPTVFTADHPFLFAIYSSKHRMFYFLGHILDLK